MKRILVGMLVGSAALMATSASAATLFSDSLTGSLATPNWASNNSGQIVSAPGGGQALSFASLGSGQDLVSTLISGTGPGTYRLSVDYYCAKPSGCGGYIGLAPGSSTTTVPSSGDAWLLTDTQSAYGTPFSLSDTSSFTTTTINFSVTSPGQFGIKLEDFVGAGGVAGDAYFRNLTLSAVPEPATWAMLLLGFGMIGFAMRKRSNVRTTVSYA